MKKFYGKVLFFILLLVIGVIGIEYASMQDSSRQFIAKVTNSEQYITGNVGSDEIKPYIFEAQKNSSYTKLIVGDSVCHQMYHGLQEYNEDICMLGSNAAITMAGQYILVEEFLKNHENVTDVYLIIIPTSLKTTFDTTWGYQYTAMPFVETNTIQLLEEKTIAQMEDVYGKFFMKAEVVSAMNRSAVNRKIYLNELQKHVVVDNEKEISEVSLTYIEKMKLLCDKKGVKFHLYAGPVADTGEKHELVEVRLKEEYENSVLKKYFPEYLNEIVFYPEEQFTDGIHFGGKWKKQEEYNKKIKEMYEGTELLEQLHFE